MPAQIGAECASRLTPAREPDARHVVTVEEQGAPARAELREVGTSKPWRRVFVVNRLEGQGDGATTVPPTHVVVLREGHACCLMKADEGDRCLGVRALEAHLTETTRGTN
jgi:hypothetical protein